MIFVGMTRFSVYQPNSVEWNASSGNTDSSEYLDYLYSDERMEFRLHTFLELSLPQLSEASKGFDYIHIVQYSKIMPEKFRKELLAASEKFPFLKLIEVEPETRYDYVWDEIKKYFDAKSLSGQTPFGYFNLDDDDLLSTDYFEAASKYIKKDNVGFYLSFGLGLTGYYDFERRKLESLRSCYHPKINIGLMAISSYDGNEFFIPKRGSHTTVDHYSPLIIDSRSYKFFWIRSLQQDTTLLKTNEREVIAKIKEDLDRHKEIAKPSELDLYFPALKQTSVVPPDEEVVLFQGEEVLSKSGSVYGLNIPAEAREFRIKYNLSCPSDVPPHAALVSVRFEDNDMDTSVSGLNISGAKHIGYYRYFDTKPGTVEASVSFTLAGSRKISEVAVFRWKESPVLLKKLSISAK